MNTMITPSRLHVWLMAAHCLFSPAVLSLKPPSLPNKGILSRRLWIAGMVSIPPFLALGEEDTVNAAPFNPPYLAEEYYLPTVTAPSAGQAFFPALTPPFRRRATYRYTLGRNMWALEQLLTFNNVTATIRCTVVQLEESGGLWVHSPQYPTGEFRSLLDELGKVEHVVVPCNALEHKAPVKDFLKYYPDAQVWVSPGMYGPFGSCGTTIAGTGLEAVSKTMGYKVNGILGDPASPVPSWSKNEMDLATLYVDLPENAGPVSEVAFCHKPTKTLIATDAVVFIPPGPAAPDIFSTYFDDKTLADTSFWARTVLQSVFLPLREEGSNRYPSFENINSRLIRAPILRAFVDARAPEQVRNWANVIATWKFDRIVTSHFASPVVAGPSDFAQAYAYLSGSTGSQPTIVCEDWELLGGLSRFIDQQKLGAPEVFDFRVGCQEIN